MVWHQDAGLQADGSVSTAPIEERLTAFGIGKIVNVWTPLVNVNAENGAMKFIPGSQKLGILEHEIGGSYPGVSNGPGKYYANVKAQKMSELEHLAVDVLCEPGDVVLFSNILVHRGGQNSSDHIRWSLDWRFQDAAKPTWRTENGHIVRSLTDP